MPRTLHMVDLVRHHFGTRGDVGNLSMTEDDGTAGITPAEHRTGYVAPIQTVDEDVETVLRRQLVTGDAQAFLAKLIVPFFFEIAVAFFLDLFPVFDIIGVLSFACLYLGGVLRSQPLVDGHTALDKNAVIDTTALRTLPMDGKSGYGTFAFLQIELAIPRDRNEDKAI